MLIIKAFRFCKEIKNLPKLTNIYIIKKWFIIILKNLKNYQI